MSREFEMTAYFDGMKSPENDCSYLCLVVVRISSTGSKEFVVLPQRWIVERYNFDV